MELLSEVKLYLNIRYDDPDEDQKVQGFIERGKSLINKYAGTELNYNEEEPHKQLLFDYCRYARSQATEMFEKNYLHDLVALREQEEVKNYENQIKSAVSNL